MILYKTTDGCNLSDISIVRGVELLKIDIISLSKGNRYVEYHVKNVPICEYDQHSRARIGVTFFDYIVDEQPNYIFYTHVFNMLLEDRKFFDEVFDVFSDLEEIRRYAKVKQNYNLMSRSCSYKVKQTFDSLKGQMSRRLKLCEEEFIVGLHFLLRDKLINEYGVEEAKNWLPGCDYIKKCDYSSADFLSNAFGCLFSACGRWKPETEYATFNESCTNIEELEKQLNIKIPRSAYELEKK